MYIVDILWLDEIVDKLVWKHNVAPAEVAEVLMSNPHFRFVSNGRRNREENVYAAYGQTHEGRYLTVFFIHKQGHLALVISARDMDDKERRRYGRN
ncbi:MAG: BrnT family toxin [Caldilineaceae bacterium]